MIITEQKPFDEVVKSIEGSQKVFIMGCGSCATAWHTGGETEVKEIAQKLKDLGKEVTGWMVVEECCDERKNKREQRAHKQEIDNADAVLVMSCGAGVQTTALSVGDKAVYPALNSMYVARIQRLSQADERCVLCGDCILANTGGICPIATCPKELVSGPCGGYRHGKCEVDPDRDCAWAQIYSRLGKLGQLDRLENIQTLKDFSKRKHPRKTAKEAAATPA
ncbi:MAG: methylenetetrahydrofolate reductase C-terminal domain-containing protein [Dehalococcoidia bacterium]|nr:methylenetetrahydrofolate reductase C-terminal domain-containing protein [Dehalococcoidia bacterium]